MQIYVAVMKFILFICSENRYVLFLTENYAALNILKNPKNYLSDEMSFGAVQNQKSIDPSDSEPFILFGSSFPKDQKFTQVRSNHNRNVYI